MNPPSKPSPAQVAFDDGITLINNRHRDTGEAKLREAARLGHPHAEQAIRETRFAYKVVGLARAGKVNLALSLIGEAERGSPPPSVGIMSQLRQAVEEHQEGRPIEPENAGDWADMGITLLSANQFVDAISCLQKAIALDATYELAWINLGVALTKSGDLLNAIVAFDRLLALNPRSVHGWHIKGMCLGTLQRHAEAVVCYDRALELDPRLAEAWYNKSLAVLWLQRFEEAIACCDQAFFLDPRHLGALMNKAKALQRLGRMQECLACWTQMNLIDPVAAAKLLKV